MSHEHTPDTPHPLFTGSPSPPLIDVLYYLGAFALFLTVPCGIAATFLSNHTQEDLVLVVGIAAGALGLLCWGLCAVLLYQHPDWPWPWPLLGDTVVTRREHAFVVAWMGFVGAAGFGALAVLIATLGLSSLNDPAFTISAVIFIVISGAPAWIVWRRVRRRILAPR